MTNKTKLAAYSLTIIAVVLLAFAIAGCKPGGLAGPVESENTTEIEKTEPGPDKPEKPHTETSNTASFDINHIEVAKGFYEITETDIFAIENITASEIQVLGIKLGDSAETVINTLGEPDILNEHKGNVFNLEYGSVLGLDKAGVIIHIIDEAVQKITLQKPFDEYLVGSTTIDSRDTVGVYRAFGNPDSQFEEYRVRVFFYDDTGIDIVLYRGRMHGISLRDISAEEPEKEKEPLIIPVGA